MDIEKEIILIGERNKRVEFDKEWETSWTRRVVIASLTYVVASIWLLIIDNAHPLLTALVPTGGYILSTLSLPLIKKKWSKIKIS